MYELNLELPEWIDTFLAEYPVVISSMENQMRFVLDLTERNIREKTGGPFGAAVFEQESGKLVSVGVNVVVEQNCSAAHAEMMALMLAQKKIGHYDLGDVGSVAHRLVTSGKMCAMCLGNVCWSGIKEVVSSAEPEDVERITGFDEGPTPPDYNDQLKLRGINLVPELLREQGKKVLQLYIDQNGLVYNATR
ncbi:MAG: nucleoside deaminase [SAR324 cluster bacterium]|nr:nucleoside deaminase [SAR324 cluster bacterium]